MDGITGIDGPQLQLLSEGYGGACPVEPRVWSRLQTSAWNSASRLAVASLHQPPGLYNIITDAGSDTYLRWTYTHLSVAVDRLAGSLQRLGAKRGTAVATLLSNGVEYIIAFWAVHKLGCRFVPLNPKTLANAEEASHMLRVAGVTIVIVQDSQAAAIFDTLHREANIIQTKIIVSDDSPSPEWLAFANLMQPDIESPSSGDSDETDDEIVSVLFTSGTTSLPKGVPHTDTSLNAFCQNLSVGGRSETHIFCAVLPNNHAMGYFYPLHFMMNGGAIVYPSPGFDAAAMVLALEQESCSHTALVPTTLHALLETLKARGSPLKSSLIDVCLSGSSVTPDNMRQVIYELGSSGISTGFGMTEGSPIWTAPMTDPEHLINGELTIAGSPAPGVHVRLCSAESKVVVARGEVGEVHQSGPGVTKAYLGTGIGTESFYSDENGKVWFITGDQGVMLPDGRISITGRYKDMIIRGGENIAPAAIESVLNKFCGIQTQVVGAPDSIAGELPVVVLSSLGETTIRSLQEAVLQHMGPAYVPDEVITLKELGLDDFPKTISGKVQKSQLADLVRKFRDQRDDAPGDKTTAKRSIHDTLLFVYFKSCGVPVEHLDLNTPVTNYADSISFMRVRDFLRKELGFSLTLAEIAEYPTLSSQIKLLEKRDFQSRNGVRAPEKLLGPPSLDELSIAFGGDYQARKMKEKISKTVESVGFDWEADVATVIPTHDYMQVMLESELINSWNFALALMADKSNVEQFRTALVKALTNNPLFVSLYVLDQHKNPHYVTLKGSPKLWDMCIVDYKTAKTVAEVQALSTTYPYQEHARAPGPLFRCILMHCEETNSAAMVMYVHHLVHDAWSTRLFYEDIEQSLTHPNKELRPHVDFKAWADSYQSLRHSPAATASVNYHVNRLKTLHLHEEGLYPPAPLPRKAITDNPDGLDAAFDAPGLIDMKAAYPEVTAPVILKAALALVNVSRTQHSHSLFYSLEAARTKFPFVPPSLEAMNPEAFEATDVNGPVMEGVCNLIEVPRHQTTISLLKHLQAEQLEQTKHAHAPHRRIIENLNASGTSAGELMVETHRTQFLSWVPGFLGEYEQIRVAMLAIRCVIGLVCVGGIAGPKSTMYTLSMRWDVANYSREETQAFVDDIKFAVLWLTNKDNWDAPIIKFLQDISVAGGEKKIEEVRPLDEGVSFDDAVSLSGSAESEETLNAQEPEVTLQKPEKGLREFLVLTSPVIAPLIEAMQTPSSEPITLENPIVLPKTPALEEEPISLAAEDPKVSEDPVAAEQKPTTPEKSLVKEESVVSEKPTEVEVAAIPKDMTERPLSTPENLSLPESTATEPIHSQKPLSTETQVVSSNLTEAKEPVILEKSADGTGIAQKSESISEPAASELAV